MDGQIPPFPPSNPAINLDLDARSYLYQSARWAKFIAIVGFVICGLMIIGAIFVGAIFGFLSAMTSDHNVVFPGLGIGGGVITILYLAIAVIYFFPCYYLLNFANRMMEALRFGDHLMVTRSLKYMRNYLRYVGIFIIVIMVFYAGLFFFASLTSFIFG